jgi:hypothetical protein
MAANPTPQPLTQTELLDNLHVTPQPSRPLVPDASAYLANIVSDMHAHTVRVSYFFVGIIVLVLTLASAGGYFGLKAYESQAARATALEARYDADRTTWQANLTQHDIDRAAAQAQVTDLQAQIAHRAVQPLPQPVQAGLKTDATAEQAKTALEAVYGADKTFGSLPPTQGPNVALSVLQTQAIIVTKAGFDKAVADLQDQKSISSLQTGTINSLQTDLTSCKSTVAESGKVIEAYKKLAVRSKWQKFMSGAEKVVFLVAGGAIGHLI